MNVPLPDHDVEAALGRKLVSGQGRRRREVRQASTRTSITWRRRRKGGGRSGEARGAVETTWWGTREAKRVRERVRCIK